ncbi:MAG: hypothetical protein JNL61_19450 [Rhizobiaceae bacterium]|nr:hypothetical protein [Rhizobiaceae bacterium]
MLTTIKAAAMTAFIGLGALAALPATAQADNVYLGFGGDRGGAQFGVEIGNDDWRGRDWRDDDWRRDDWRREAYYRACTPQRAIDKAWRIGVRNPRVIEVDRRTIEVRGHKRGHRVNILFGRAPNCPIIG